MAIKDTKRICCYTLIDDIDKPSYYHSRKKRYLWRAYDNDIKQGVIVTLSRYDDCLVASIVEYHDTKDHVIISTIIACAGISFIGGVTASTVALLIAGIMPFSTWCLMLLTLFAIIFNALYYTARKETKTDINNFLEDIT